MIKLIGRSCVVQYAIFPNTFMYMGVFFVLPKGDSNTGSLCGNGWLTMIVSDTELDVGDAEREKNLETDAAFCQASYGADISRADIRCGR